MAIIRTIPAQKIINGQVINTSEVSLISELEYSTNGEDCIVTMGVSESTIIFRVCA